MKNGLFTLMLLIITVLPALAAPSNTTGPWGVDVSSFSSFSSAKISPATLGKTMVITKVMNVNTATVTGRELDVKKGGGFNVPTGKTLIIPRPNAGDYQIFFGAGTVKIVSGSVNSSWFGTDKAATAAVNAAAIGKAIVAATPIITPPGYATPAGRVIDIPSDNYKIAAIPQITTPVILDFHNSYLYPDTTGIVIDFNYSNAFFNAEKAMVKDVTFLGPMYAASTPVNLIKITDGYNVILDNVNAWGVLVSHSFVYNYHAAGLTLLNNVYRGGVAPAAVYLGVIIGENPDQSFSNAVTIDHLDISAHTGLGLFSEAGNVVVRGMSTFEGCSLGGIKFARGTNNSIVTDSYFEDNDFFDIGFMDLLYHGNYSIRANLFTGAPGVSTNNKLLISDPSISGMLSVTAQDNVFYFGGVNVDSLHTTGRVQYTGINNIQTTSTVGYTGTYDLELSDAIRPIISYNIVNKQGFNGVPVSIKNLHTGVFQNNVSFPYPIFNTASASGFTAESSAAALNIIATPGGGVMSFTAGKKYRILFNAFTYGSPMHYKIVKLTTGNLLGGAAEQIIIPGVNQYEFTCTETSTDVGIWWILDHLLGGAQIYNLTVSEI